MWLQESWEPPRQPTQRKKMILSSCGRRSKRGSVNAEVALANLYLQGEGVPQNCEQAHMLLYAASMKGSKAADSFLQSSYAERCR